MTLFSQNGWIAGTRAELGIQNYQVPGSNRYISCNPLVAPILIEFAAWFHKYIEKIDVGQYDDWGYATPVVIPGSNVISNHGSGTAEDLNSTRHPWKSVKSGFSKLQEIRIRWKCRQLGIRWGFDYTGWKDPMHYEIIETPAQVKARIAKMKLPMPQVSK